jgi:hypothetical protein
VASPKNQRRGENWSRGRLRANRRPLCPSQTPPLDREEPFWYRFDPRDSQVQRLAERSVSGFAGRLYPISGVATTGDPRHTAGSMNYVLTGIIIID